LKNEEVELLVRAKKYLRPEDLEATVKREPIFRKLGNFFSGRGGKSDLISEDHGVDLKKNVGEEGQVEVKREDLSGDERWANLWEQEVKAVEETGGEWSDRLLGENGKLIKKMLAESFVDEQLPNYRENLAKLEAMQELIDKNVTEALSEKTRLEEQIGTDVELLEWVNKKMRREKRDPSGGELEAAARVRTRMEACREAIENLPETNPDAFYAIHMQEMVENSREFHEGGRLIETAYVKRKAAILRERLGQGKVVFLHGDTGTGKTEIARAVAAKYSGKEPELVRGYPGMSSEEMFGHMGLTVDDVIGDYNQLWDKIEVGVKQWREEHPNESVEEENQARDLIREKVVREGGATVSEFVLGAVYKAAKEGKVVIVDEANYVPPGLLAKLNDIMTKVPGEKVKVQEDGVGPITVAEGFGMVMTGNLDVGTSKHYEVGKSGRQKFDEAFRDRITLLEYDYLPQAIEGKLEQIDDPEQKQLFEIILESMMGKDDGGVYLPDEMLEKLWNLAKLAKITQLAFAGRVSESSLFAFNAGGGKRMAAQTESLLSNRAVMQIAQEWQTSLLSQETKDLDQVLYPYLIEKAATPKEAVYFHQLGKAMGFFQESDGWVQPDYDLEKTGGRFVMAVKEGEMGEEEWEKMRYHTPLELVEALHGPPPEREVWPDGVITEDIEAEMIATKEWLEEQERNLEMWRERIGNYCPREESANESEKKE
jgi:MoxR-like ATPase